MTASQAAASCSVSRDRQHFHDFDPFTGEDRDRASGSFTSRRPTLQMGQGPHRRAPLRGYPAVVLTDRRPRCPSQSILSLSEQRIRTWQNRQSQAMVCRPRIRILRLSARWMRPTRKPRESRSSSAAECLPVQQPVLLSGRQWPGPSAWLWAEQSGRSPAQSAVLQRDRCANRKKTRTRRSKGRHSRNAAPVHELRFLMGDVASKGRSGSQLAGLAGAHALDRSLDRRVRT